MKIEVKKTIWPSLISSGVILVLGLLLFFKSSVTLMGISYIFGGLIIAIGVLAIVRFISNNHSDISNQLNIIYGIICIISGIFFIEKPEIIGSIIPVVMGIGIIISSSLKIQQSFNLKSLNSSYFFWSFVTALLSLISGVVLLFNPFKGAVIITKVIGIFLAIYAILDICNTIVLKKSGVSISISTVNDKDIKSKSNHRKAKDAKIIKEVTKAGQIPAAAWVPNGISDTEDANGDFRQVGGDYYSVKEEDFQKNIEEAKKLLADAGYSNGNSLPVIEFKSNSGAHIQIFEAVQQMWKEYLNIDSTVSQEEWATFQNTRLNKEFVVARHGWIGDYNDPMTFLGVFLSYSAQNDGGYSNRDYDNNLKIAMSTTDQKVRMEAMHKAETILMQDMGLIPIYFYTDPIMVSKKLKGVVYDPLGWHKFLYAELEK